MAQETCDVAIIGAGPAGAVAAALLVQKGWRVHVFERQHFPRFSIGESLLPQCVDFLRQANLFELVKAHGFQPKDGAAFSRSGAYQDFRFPDKSSPGPGTVFQVKRDEFDKILIDGAIEMGAKVSFGTSVTAYSAAPDHARLTVCQEDGSSRTVRAKFVLDASGFGRVLTRLLDLSLPSDQTVRRSCYKHVHDNIVDARFDRSKILISVHPDDPKVWLWLIPLADGQASIGVVGEDKVIESAGDCAETRLDYFVSSSGLMAQFLKNATQARPAAETAGFSSKVKSLIGPRYALLGNAAEFLDPVFSSGVTIAMKSATLAADLVDRDLRGQPANWETEFCDELNRGVDVFRTCVNAWYDGLLQRLIFRDTRAEKITSQFTSILAGYVWDQSNPIAGDPARFFGVMEAFISE